MSEVPFSLPPRAHRKRSHGMSIVRRVLREHDASVAKRSSRVWGGHLVLCLVNTPPYANQGRLLGWSPSVAVKRHSEQEQFRGGGFYMASVLGPSPALRKVRTGTSVACKQDPSRHAAAHSQTQA